MKPTSLLIALLLSYCSFAQDNNETTIEAKLFLPTHLKNDIAPGNKLVVYFITLPDDTVRVPPKVIAKKVRENVYEFKLPTTKLWYIGFSIGNFGYSMMCVDNRQGDAADNYNFHILLERNKDFIKPKFLPPCIRTDDDD
jgi:hypothetical protein